MNYQAFKEAILEAIRKKTQGRKQVFLRQVEKNNGILLEAVVIRGEEEMMVPTIYLEEYYQSFREGVPLEALVEQIMKAEKEQKMAVKFSLEDFEDYTKARHHIYYKLVNYKMNQKMLANMPHVKYLDLAVVFYYRLESSNFHGATVLIHHCNVDTWGVGKRRVMEDAVLNTSRKLPYTFQGMEALVAELTGEECFLPEKEELMYVLTNEEKLFGAAVILYPHVLSHIGKILKKNFYILPSSVHECILVPDQGQYSRLELMKMVREVNQSQVEEEEVLSNEVYYYDRKKEALLM